MQETRAPDGGGLLPPTRAEQSISTEKLYPLALAALGVVYGDIGTSPLYAVKICFSGEHGAAPTPDNVLGVLSLVFWSIMFVVSFKYLRFVIQADNQGEGGILALLALLTRKSNGDPAPVHPWTSRDSLHPAGHRAGPPTWAVWMVLFGAALLFGDGVITPAISVLSAVEGLNVATTAFEPYILWITTGILLALFVVQSKGTGSIGRVFGIVMLVWFSALAFLGIYHIVQTPQILWALNPWLGIRFLSSSGFHGFLVLGGVFLCVTGTEAMYADMGHFGKRAIQIGWIAIVMPSLLLNYFGQGALLLSRPEASASLFYEMVPHWGLYPMVVLATAATIIASQALISGAFSLNNQSIQLGYCPRLTVVHTSRTHEGQIYIPEVNYALMAGCITLVWIFKSSDNLAAAYGIAVSGVMLITSIMYYFVTRRTWGWSLRKALPLLVLFLAVDVTFLSANSVKFFQGGWMPILMAIGIFTLMTTWKEGRRRLAKHLGGRSMDPEEFLIEVRDQKTPRVKGTAVFLTANPAGVPPILVHHWKHGHALHEQVVILSVITSHVPHVQAKNRLTFFDLGNGFYRVVATYGYIQIPNVPIILQGCALFDLVIDLEDVTYYLGRETLIPSASTGMSYWRKALFSIILRNSRSATAYFGIPPEQVEELGMQVEL